SSCSSGPVCWANMLSPKRAGETQSMLALSCVPGSINLLELHKLESFPTGATKSNR
ncbi:hypothetical protein BaRGS_00026720, partial [Batillaria attramentaria]